jgi:hypothetical protein
VIHTRRLLAGAAAALGFALLAAACDTSPVAASVGGVEIKQTSLNAELAAVSSNKAFVAYYDTAQSNESDGIQIVGDAPGTYGTKFVAQTLTGKIQALVEQQYLAAHHDLPGSALIADLSAFEAASYRSEWPGFAPTYQEELAEHLADLDEFVPVSTDVAALRAAVKDSSPYLYSQVCVRQVAASVDGASGQVNYPAALAKIKSYRPNTGGVVTCYTPAQLEVQGLTFYERVIALKVGQTTPPIKTAFGYQTDGIVSRTALPFDAAMRRAASLVVASNAADGLQLPALSKILSAAKVHLNPQYGTWSAKDAAVIPPTTLGANGTQTSAGS